MKKVLDKIAKSLLAPLKKAKAAPARPPLPPVGRPAPAIEVPEEEDYRRAAYN